jgi:replicative DNA helicase
MTETERAFLGSLLLDPSKLCDVSLLPDQMGRDAGELYAAIIRLDKQGVKPDYLSLAKALPKMNAADIADIGRAVGSAGNIGFYERELSEAWTREKLRRLGMVLQEKRGVDELLATVERELVEISGVGGKRAVSNVADLMLDFINLVEKRYNSHGEMPGIRTGVNALDACCLGLQPSLLYIIGARPSQGKSALMLNIAAHIAYKEKRKVGLLSLESGMNEIISRLVASMGRVSAGRIKSGVLSAADLQGVLEAGGRIADGFLYAWDQPNAKLTDVVSTCRQMVRKHGCEVLFLDYAQIVRVPGAIDRRAAAEETSMTMKELARELEVPIVMAAQLKRDADGRRPTFADFQWTSQFEQDADVAVLIQHIYKTNSDDPYQIESSWLLADKVRDGQKTAIPITFQQEYVTFTDNSREA